LTLLRERSRWESPGAHLKLHEQTSKRILNNDVPFSQPEVESLMREIHHWILDDRTIMREFRFKDFRQAMDFTNRVAEIANQEDHHPDLFISYNKVRVTLSTHKINGLTLNDFIVAAKIDRVADEERFAGAAE
jgi:4a-hydroxytetrahydrobiopterin dehydratase